MIHIDPSRCFHSYRPATRTRASLISVLIWIKSSSRYSSRHNIARRHMTAGQRAMAYAKIYPQPEKGGRGKLAKIGEFPGITHQRVADARLWPATISPANNVE